MDLELRPVLSNGHPDPLVAIIVLIFLALFVIFCWAMFKVERQLN